MGGFFLLQGEGRQVGGFLLDGMRADRWVALFYTG